MDCQQCGTIDNNRQQSAVADCARLSIVCHADCQLPGVQRAHSRQSLTLQHVHLINNSPHLLSFCASASLVHTVTHRVQSPFPCPTPLSTTLYNPVYSASLHSLSNACRNLESFAYIRTTTGCTRLTGLSCSLMANSYLPPHLPSFSSSASLEIHTYCHHNTACACSTLYKHG